MTVAGVIFDLFHTLTGRESEWSELPTTAEALGLDRRLWDELLVSGSRWRLAGEEKDPHAIIGRLARTADPSISHERIAHAVDVRIRRFRDALQRIPQGNVDALRALRRAGYRLGLVSNADVMEIAAWPESPLCGLFDAEIFSCAVGCVKPERAIFEACLSALEVPAEACVFVGDGGANELIGAKDVGMKTVFVSGIIAELWPERVAERLTLCDHHIDFVPELVAWLAGTAQPPVSRHTAGPS